MKKVVGILVLIIMVMTTISFAAYSEEIIVVEGKNEDIELISEESLTEEVQMIYDDVYRMEDEVVINQIIDGNVYVMGKSVKIDGATIYGNVYVIAQKIEVIEARINGSVYAIGENVEFSGVANDIYMLGSSLKFDENTNILRSARIASENLNFDGKIGRNLLATVSNLTIGDTATIQGSVNYASENEGIVSENAQIGEIKFEKQEEIVIDEDEEEKIDVSTYVFDAIGAIIKTALVAVIIVFLVSKFYVLSRTQKHANDLIKAFGKGAAVLIIVPILAIILMITIIGLGFGVSLFAIYVILLWISIPVISTEIAYRILDKKQPEGIKKSILIGVSALVSLVIWGVAEFVPVIGGFLNFVLLLMGLGVLFDLIFVKIKKEEELNEN